MNEEAWGKKIENDLQDERERENYIFSVKWDMESKKGKVVLWKEENKKEKLRERRCAWLEREREWDKLIWPNLSFKSCHNIFWVFSLSFFRSLSFPFLNLIAIVFAKNDLRLRSTEILSLFSLLFFIHFLFNHSLSTSFSFSFTCFSLSQELQLWAHQHLHMPRHPLDTDFCYHHHRQIRWTLLHYHFGDHLGPVRILYLADLKECEGGKERREKRRKET